MKNLAKRIKCGQSRFKIRLFLILARRLNPAHAMKWLNGVYRESVAGPGYLDAKHLSHVGKPSRRLPMPHLDESGAAFDNVVRALEEDR